MLIGIACGKGLTAPAYDWQNAPEPPCQDRVMPIAETRNTNPKNLIAGATGDWEVIIGLEVHAQVLTASKPTMQGRVPLPQRGAKSACFRTYRYVPGTAKNCFLPRS